jgi:streptogramin lyase
MTLRISLAGLLSAAFFFGLVAPSVAGATAIKEFPLPAGSDPLGITAGADGNLWFSNAGTTAAIGRITPAGSIKQFTQGLAGTGKPADIALGPDHNLWFTTVGGSPNAIGRVTTSGHITEFTAGLNPGASPSGITVGPDGNLWFLDDGSTKAIGRVKPNGTINEFVLADPLNSNLEDLTPGPDGSMWFTDRGNTKAIGRVKPNGAITEFAGALNQMNSQPNGITAGAGGNLWFTDEGSPGAVGRAAASNASSPTEFTTGLQSNSVPDGITTGAHGTVWFEDNYSGQRAIGRITATGAIKEFTQGLGSGLGDDITLGPDGNVWVEQSMPGGIARITPAGVITQFNSGLLPGAGGDGDQLTTGPDGNLWFTDRGASAIGRVSVQLRPAVKTEAASAISLSAATISGLVTPLGAPAKVALRYGKTRGLGSTAAAGTLSASADPQKVQAKLTRLPPSTVIYYRIVASNQFGSTTGRLRNFKTRPGHVRTATTGNQRITLVTPLLSTCSTKTLEVFLTRTRLSHGTKLRFISAAFFIGSARGGGTHRVPATRSLPIAGLSSGSHQLKVVLHYSRHTRHVLKTMFRAC